MAIKTLICGLSGTGKSRSMKTFAEAGITLAVVNPVNKPLPFKNNFEMLNGETDARKIMTFMKKVVGDGIKHIVVDDFQYLLSIPYMRRIKETGWDKYNDFAANYWEIISVCDSLPNDVTVYFMTHTETLEDGQETVKLIGKLLREKICIEGLFTIVLKTLVSDGKYYFVTQNNGRDNVKSPEDMFPSYAIDNDLKYIDDKIRNYYQIGEFLTDEEIAEIDEGAKHVDVIKDEGKKGRRRNGKKEEEKPADTSKEETKEETADGAEPKRRRRAKADVDNNDQPVESNTGGSAETVPVTEPKRRRKSVRDNMAEERAAVNQENGEAIANANTTEDGSEIPFEETEMPELKEPPRRKRRTEESAMNAPEEPEETQEEAAPRRRRRRG